MQEIIGAGLLAFRAAMPHKFAVRRAASTGLSRLTLDQRSHDIDPFHGDKSQESPLGIGFTVKLLAAAVAVALFIPLPSSQAQAPSSEDPDWPCIQRKVPEISPGMVWAGPPIGKLENAWRNDPEINQLASKIASRSMAIEDAKKVIENFASGLGADRNRKLTMLFASTLRMTNLDCRLNRSMQHKR